MFYFYARINSSYINTDCCSWCLCTCTLVFGLFKTNLCICWNMNHLVCWGGEVWGWKIPSSRIPFFKKTTTKTSDKYSWLYAFQIICFSQYSEFCLLCKRAVLYSVCVCVCVCVCVLSQFSHVWLFATPWTVACQAPLSMAPRGSSWSRDQTCISYVFCIGGSLPLVPPSLAICVTCQIHMQDLACCGTSVLLYVSLLLPLLRVACCEQLTMLPSGA